jgi:hypothetical protein
VPGESLTGRAVWRVVVTGCALTEAAAPWPAFAAATPISQVMPDTGKGEIDGEVFPKKYHDEATTNPAPSTTPRMMRAPRGVFVAERCIWIKVASSHQVNR